MTGPPIGGARDIRRQNLSVLLRLLHVGGPMRRAELTGLTGLNRSTVAGLVAELAGLGAVVQEPVHPASAGPGPSRAGRPSPVVRPRPERVQVLAADVAVGRVSTALIGLGGVVMARRTRPVTDTSPVAVARLVAAAGRDLLHSPRVGDRVVGLGVSVPGVVRVSDGNVRFAPNLGWHDEPFGELVDDALRTRRVGGLAVRVGNDGDLGALAEHQRGVARGIDDVVFLEGEVGVGCGVIIDGRPLIGAGGYAGELGHMIVHPGGRLCRCGAKGCWETEIGAAAVGQALGLPPGSGQAAVLSALRSLDPRRAARLDDVAHYLGAGLANVVNLLNPRLIVLGGLLRELYPLIPGRVAVALAESALSAPAEQVTLALPKLGGDAVLLGAAEFIWQETLADPAAVLRRRPV